MFGKRHKAALKAAPLTTSSAVHFEDETSGYGLFRDQNSGSKIAKACAVPLLVCSSQTITPGRLRKLGLP
ncbi:hypothetical protein QLX08_001722 [Tetragonisca angustula]|uniref:Uncharacterized protein n=1 Tax=Tetragonisca angustula TaxID=166442 RepID=A0AAW1ADU3_9HYME